MSYQKTQAVNDRASFDTILLTFGAADSKYVSASGDEFWGGTGTGAAADIEPAGWTVGVFGVGVVVEGWLGTGATPPVPWGLLPAGDWGVSASGGGGGGAEDVVVVGVLGGLFGALGVGDGMFGTGAADAVPRGLEGLKVGTG